MVKSSPGGDSKPRFGPILDSSGGLKMVILIARVETWSTAGGCYTIFLCSRSWMVYIIQTGFGCGLCTILPSPTLYGVWHKKKGGRGE